MPIEPGATIVYQRLVPPRPGSAYCFIDDGFISGLRSAGYVVMEWFDAAGEAGLAQVLDRADPEVFLGCLQNSKRRESRWVYDDSLAALQRRRRSGKLKVALRVDPSNMPDYQTRFGINFERHTDSGVASYYLAPQRPTQAERRVLESGVIDLLRTPHARETFPELFRNYLDIGLPILEEPFAADTARYAPPAPAEPTADVVFIGNCWSFKYLNMAAYIEALRDAFGRRFLIYGRGWPDGLAAGELIPHNGEDPFDKAVASTRVLISLHEPTQVTDFPFAPNERVYKLLAMEAAVVSDSNPMLMRQFAHGREILFADSPADMVKHCRRLLDDDDLRRSLGRAGRRRVLSEHTYEIRAQRVIGLLDDQPEPGALLPCCAIPAEAVPVTAASPPG